MIDKVIIVGSGPTGSFTAVLCLLIRFQVIVYEKRQEFTRNINLKLNATFFKGIQEILSRLNASGEFFERFSELLLRQNEKILIKDFESRFVAKAKELGAQYISSEETSFHKLYKEHEQFSPIILDCTGRNSQLRINEFGPDAANLVTSPLQYAMYINVKAIVTGTISLYQVMKYISNVKLTEVVISKAKDENGFSHLTIPAFITKELAKQFDEEYPDINRYPINPFNSLALIPDSIFSPISSLIGNLIVDGCCVDLNSVTVKKIVIGCGYARIRSRNRFVCLGDSAAHLAFFRSLNLGLKHALSLFVSMSMYRSIESAQIDVLHLFKQDNPHLMPVRIVATASRNVYFIITKVILYGCFSYNVIARQTLRLTNHLGVPCEQIAGIFDALNQNLSAWSGVLNDFEKMRDDDIKSEIHSNKEKNVILDYASWLIDANGKSNLIKLNEVARAFSGRLSLYKGDFNFLLRCFKARTRAVQTCTDRSYDLLIKIISSFLNQGDSSELNQLKNICSDKSLSIQDEVQTIRQMSSNITVLPKNKLSLLVNIDVTTKIIFALIKNELGQSGKENDVSTVPNSFVLAEEDTDLIHFD